MSSLEKIIETQSKTIEMMANELTSSPSRTG